MMSNRPVEALPVVLVIDDDPQGRTQLSAMLHTQADVSACDFAQAERVQAGKTFDVICLQHRAGRGNAQVVLMRLLDRYPDATGILLITYADYSAQLGSRSSSEERWLMLFSPVDEAGLRAGVAQATRASRLRRRMHKTKEGG